MPDARHVLFARRSLLLQIFVVVGTLVARFKNVLVYTHNIYRHHYQSHNLSSIVRAWCYLSLKDLFREIKAPKM